MKSPEVRFSDLRPGERFQLSLRDGAAVLIKTGAKYAFATDLQLEVNYEEESQALVFALDRNTDYYGITDEVLIEPGFYSHYERGLCDVFGTATDHDTGKTMVVFLVMATGKVWTRSLEEFKSFVDLGNGVMQPRFTHVPV